MFNKISLGSGVWVLCFPLLMAILYVSCQAQPSQDQPALPAVSFAYYPASPIAGQPIQFTDTSTGAPTSWQWSFGDGTTSSVQNPSRTYSAAGTFTVSLTASNKAGSGSSSLLITVLSEPKGYYVDVNSPNANDSNPGTEALPWKTITKANQMLTAGDAVYIKSGTYATYIAPQRSGTSSYPIIYRAYGSDLVTVRDASYGILIDGKSYIIVQGIKFAYLDKFLWLQNGANHNTIAYCSFDQGRTIGWSGSKIYRSSSHNWVHHCSFSKYGEYTTDDIGAILDIGNEESQTDISNYNLLENSALFHAGHHILGVYGAYNVIRNNYFHNENWLNDHGNRNIMLSGYMENSGHNLIEGNLIAYSGYPPDNWGASGMALTTSYNIVRLNRFNYNNLAGIAMGLTSSYTSDIISNKIYNNTFLHNGFNMTNGPDPMTSAVGLAIYSGTHVIRSNVVKNNIFFDHYQAIGAYRVSLAEQIISDNWNGDIQGDPKFVNANISLGNPSDPGLPDLRLLENSPCLDRGGILTRIITPAGSGNQFQVEDAGYFSDGWGISGVEGDEVQIVGSQQKARIVHIDYTANTLTTNINLSWTQGQGIALSYAGSAPDPGAHEYGTSQTFVKK